tara:strand:- start:1307 stop:2275 length:969 start_codon:yes stop_codon:yes gene_type:complete
MSLKLIGVNKKINRNWLIKDIDLDVANNECIAILGPSGCGKSSTLRLIAGLEKVDKGKILINDIDVTKISPSRRKVSMVFQNYALYPHLNVSTNLSLGLKIRGISKAERHRRVSLILSSLKLESLATRYPSEISGGQRQRVALARALLRDPEIYLLDEPMSNLDAQLREELRLELKDFILNKEKPVLYVTHDQHEAMAIADKIAVMNNGRIVQIGSPRDLYLNPRSLFVATFIGRPQINIFNRKDFILGVRPEHIKLSNDGILHKVIGREWFGINQLIILEGPNGLIRVICDSSDKIPESIGISWDDKNQHKFDPKTETRIN